MPRRRRVDIEVIVTVGESGLPQLQRIASQLVAAGLTVDTTLESAGMITGHAAPSCLDRLRCVEGVQAVEPSGEVKVAPPGSDVQ
ncbi:hypothetical protein D3C76_1344420 [compost metagenome]|uniref:Ketohydroxyglutarate aldolase n=1 Tax=Pseudomonas jinjuensis TaxID=198616 RepID=A0A1H0PE94_9PSED|nr:hypothetical protein [Pseudomonas jinjuensis]SDP03334.1 hypothetical protein SAMN05216193_12063 [Pseudomonas jinjuensis]